MFANLASIFGRWMVAELVKAKLQMEKSSKIAIKPQYRRAWPPKTAMPNRRLCACWCKTLPSETLQRLSSWISSILRTGAEDCRWREWCKVKTLCKKHRHFHWLTIDGWHKSSPTGGVWLDLAHYMTTLVIKGGNGYFTIRRTTSVLLIVMVTIGYRHPTWVENPHENCWVTEMCKRMQCFCLGLSENSVPLHPMVNDHYPY